MIKKIREIKNTIHGLYSKRQVILILITTAIYLTVFLIAITISIFPEFFGLGSGDNMYFWKRWGLSRLALVKLSIKLYIVLSIITLAIYNYVNIYRFLKKIILYIIETCKNESLYFYHNKSSKNISNTLVNIKKNPLACIIYVLAGLFLLYYIILVILASTDLIIPYTLFFDELISYEGIQDIYKSNSFSEFMFNIIDGNSNLYGRIFWNISAITSYIPSLIWGGEGQVVATRLTQALLLFTSFIILIRLFIRYYLFQILALIILLLLPATLYYVQMPKPEPIQLFCLSLFFLFWKQQLSSKNTSLLAWLFLGLAFGAKISSLPLVIFMLIISLFQRENLYKKISKYIVLYLGTALAIPSLFFGKIEPLISLIISGRNNVSDSETVTPFSWIKFVIFDFFSSPAIIILLFIFIFFFGIAYLLLKEKTIFLHKKIEYFSQTNILLPIASASFILPIFLTVHRLWGFYLEIGLTFFIIAGFSGLEQIFYKIKTNQSYFILVVIIPLLTFISFQVVPMHNSYYSLTRRSSSQNYIDYHNAYIDIKKFLEQESIKQKRRISVYMNPVLFDIESGEHWESQKYWGAFLNWKDSKDFIVLPKTEIPQAMVRRESSTSQWYQDIQESVKLEKMYVGDLCKEEVCYQAIDDINPTIRIYKKLE